MALKEYNPDLETIGRFAALRGSASLEANLWSMRAALEGAKSPDVIVLIGDEAGMSYRMLVDTDTLLTRIPVVLLDVHPRVLRRFEQAFDGTAFSDTLFRSLEVAVAGFPVTAVTRREDESPTVGLLIDLTTDIKNLYFLTSGNYIDRYTAFQLTKLMARQYPEMRFEVINEYKKLPPSSGLLLYSADVPAGATVPIFVVQDRRMAGKYLVGGSYPLADAYANRATGIVARLLNGENAAAIPITEITNEIKLNIDALEHLGWRDEADELPNYVTVDNRTRVEINFKRLVMIAAIVVIGVGFVVVYRRRNIRYREQLQQSYVNFRRKYNEYQLVYNNMPIAMIHLNKEGIILSANPGSRTVMGVIAPNPDEFCLFDTDWFGRDIERFHQRRLKAVNREIRIGRHSYLMLLHTLTDAIPTSDAIPCYLLVIIDETELRLEEQRKRDYTDVFRLALDRGDIGVCRMICGGQTTEVRANDVWYRHLGLPVNADFRAMFTRLTATDEAQVELFFKAAAEGAATDFSAVLEVRPIAAGHAASHIRFIASVKNVSDDKKRITVLALTTLADAQLRREAKLAEALQHAQESDRLKDAFIANTSRDIQPTVEALVEKSAAVAASTSIKEREELLVHIQHYNDVVLAYIKKIIALSREDEEERGLGV
jgi:PAS domain-containing protein